MLALGVPPKVVAEMPGHSRIGLTTDTYSTFYPTFRRKLQGK
jgi:hypothetical protein